MSGGSISINALQFGGGTGEAVIYTTAQGGTISSPITAGALTTFGAGKLTLSNGSNSISGTTNVNGGSLNVTNAAGSATGAGAVNINNGGDLDGHGPHQ